MLAHPDVKMVDVIEAIGRTDTYNGQFGMNKVDMDRVVGKDNCVSVNADIAVTPLYRMKRDDKTPCAVGAEAQDTSEMVVGICRDDDGRHTMFTAFYCELAPKEPWDKGIRSEEERQESVDFWKSHAIAVGENNKDSIDWEKSGTTYEEVLAQNQPGIDGVDKDPVQAGKDAHRPRGAIRSGFSDIVNYSPPAHAEVGASYPDGQSFLLCYASGPASGG